MTNQRMRSLCDLFGPILFTSLPKWTENTTNLVIYC